MFPGCVAAAFSNLNPKTTLSTFGNRLTRSGFLAAIRFGSRVLCLISSNVRKIRFNAVLLAVPTSRHELGL